MSSFNSVLLLDENHNGLGLFDKMEAHKQALHHLAFSVYIFNPKGQMLLQRRALKKYHSGGCWTNACCSHPTDPAHVPETARRRLRQEMGFDTEIHQLFSFGYRAKLDRGLVEDEWDLVFAGFYSGAIKPDPAEVCDYRFVDLDCLAKDLLAQPEKYSVWFRKSHQAVIEHLRGKGCLQGGKPHA